MRRYAMGLAVILTATAGLLGGCNGSGGSDTGRARVIAVENRRLAQQIQEKDQRIAQLEAELERVKQESKAQIEQVNKATGEILQPLMEMQQYLNEENEKLKKALEYERNKSQTLPDNK